ncbi:MAG: RNA polymerase sigma factor [Lachnospiraceae bacterium]|nr:RNA polymerase sigma factor [Lachnospiraceae bacterium]MDE6625432.1 RNA polymerase sigma factor [Lachnospiraceae bacterium]
MKTEVLRQLYMKYEKEIYLYLFSLCKNREVAEDLMQETFLKALLSLKDGHTNMRAWLYMVARNLYFNYRSKEQRNVPLEGIGDTIYDEQSERMLNRLLVDERRRLLYQALQHIGEQKREILTLQYYGGLSQREIAGLLKLSPENVRVLAYRGKRELREYMEAKGYDIL